MNLRLPKLTLFFTCLLLVLIWGCSTTNHATLPKQAFYDITSHYNAYFNANEKLKNSLKVAQETHKDKFDSVIAVYYYNDTKEFAAYSSDMDDIIKRSTQAIQLRGPSNWSDDHFLLIGIANYLKGDYDKASASFKFITTEYKEGVDYVKVMKSLGKKVGKYVKKKKRVVKPEIKVITNTNGTKTLEKIDNRPSFSLWVHEPARSEALIWLIKTYSRQNQFEQATTVVTYVRNDDMFYRDLDPELDLAEADLRVSQKNYGAAIDPLIKYLGSRGVKRKKKLRVRPLFVLAQCYERTGNYQKAIENYKAVLKSRPNYDMEFYAKLKMAKLARNSNGDNKEIRSLLAKMAKDKKYNDYWDQVYYELALLAIADNQRDDGRKLLHKSVDVSTTNDDQKTLSYLKLAELDYEDERYVTSKFFYDSTLSFMAKNDARYFDVEDRDRVLSNLVTQLNIISTEDSLQRLAALPQEERARVIKNTIAKKEREEEEKKNALQTSNQLSQFNNNNQNQQNQNQQNVIPGLNLSWYFYNTVARASGYNDFIKKWGRRKLEENWRRKNKSSVSPDEEAPTDTSAANTSKDAGAGANAGTVEEQMEAAIPTSTAKLEESNAKMIDAYYTAGTIYKDGLESYPKAEDMFETLNKRFPNNKLLLESYYNLYLIATRLKQTEKAEEHKAKILAQFPESVIAKVLRDPNYINEAKRKKQEVFDYYQSAYRDYAMDSLAAAWYKTEMADNLFKPNPISAKFQLLAAMILAKQNRLADYVQLLNKIINRTTDAEVKKTATELLSALNKSNLPQVDLSLDPARRDSLNAVFVKPDTTQNELLKELNKAKEQARQSGVEVKEVKVDTSTTVETKSGEATSDTSSKLPANAPVEKKNEIVQEDTASPYTRSDVAVHYFIIYIKDPATPQSALMSTMAKVDAFNSTQFESKRLTSKQILIDSKNKVINVRQFKNREDVMEYYNLIKTQSQLFSDLQSEQFAISAISIINFSTLLSEKNIDEYNKFFKRVYQ